MNKRFLSFVILAAMTISMQAKVKLSHLVGNNMVIQQTVPSDR